MNRNKYLKYFAVLFLVTSCATTSVVVDPFDSSKTYMSDMDTQWKKLVRFFSTNQIGIGTLEKDSGIITVNNQNLALDDFSQLSSHSERGFGRLGQWFRENF